LQTIGEITSDSFSLGETFKFILQKPRNGIWGGDFGANIKNLVISITWEDISERDNESDLMPTDIIR